MDLNYLLKNYQYGEWSYTPNKKFWPINYITFDNYGEWNEIFQFAKEHYHYIKAAPSGSMPYNHKVRDVQRFCVVSKSTGFELLLMTLKGCFRFILMNGKLAKGNNITGRKALTEIYKLADEFNVKGVLKKHSVNSETGKQIKSEIESPLICTCNDDYIGQEFDNCHHIDANSAYASRISEEIPELRPMYEYAYDHRKENNDLYKHVLTNSIGCMQSEFCIDIDNGFKASPYQLAELSKIAINGNNRWIETMQMKLLLAGRKPLMINTDGIWYQGDVYHDRNEGHKLGQWKNDHTNCKLYIKTAGAYQYIEDNKVNTVLRGYTQLDRIKSRDEWSWHEIDNAAVYTYKFDNDKGIIKNGEEI